MVHRFFAYLTHGLAELRSHPSLLFVVVLLVVFPLLFTYIVQSVFDAAYQNVITAQKQQVEVLHNAVAAQISAGLSPELALSAVRDVPTLTGARVVMDEAGERIIKASTDQGEIGSVDGGSILFATAAATPGSAYIYEFSVGLERFWHAYEALAFGTETYYVVTEYSFRTVDATMAARQQLVLLGLSAIFIFLLAIAYWLIRQKNWAAAYQILADKQAEQIMFTNTVVHELRAPLTVIKGYASLLTESSTLASTERDQVKNISLATERLIVLINDFLEVARIQSGQLKVTKAAVDLVPLIKNITHNFSAEVAKKQLTLNVTGAATAPLVTDATRFTQVITNLLSNAIKYTDAGTIAVSITQTKRETVIKVRDSGQGISAEDQTRMFTPFTRVGSADTSTITGSGLGMWITKRIVELLGGAISLESIEGVGTVVKVTFRA